MTIEVLAAVIILMLGVIGYLASTVSTLEKRVNKLQSKSDFQQTKIDAVNELVYTSIAMEITDIRKTVGVLGNSVTELNTDIQRCITAQEILTNQKSNKQPRQPRFGGGQQKKKGQQQNGNKIL